MNYFKLEPTATVETPIYSYDYSSTYTLIYNALIAINTTLLSIANNTSTLASNSSTISTHLSTIATKLTEIENHQQRMRELGESTGIRIISPYEAFSFVTSYRSLIEEGRILKWRDAEPSDKDVSKALNDLGKYIKKIQDNVPRGF
jgi:hypothetical protein